MPTLLDRKHLTPTFPFSMCAKEEEGRVPLILLHCAGINIIPPSVQYRHKPKVQGAKARVRKEKLHPLGTDAKDIIACTV